MAKIFISMMTILFLGGCSTQLKNPFLWSLEKDGKTSYLIGTQHQGVPYDDLPPWVIEKIDTANVVALEAELQDIEKADIEAGKALFYRIEEPLAKTYFTDSEWSFLLKEMRGRCNCSDQEFEDILEVATPMYVEALVYGKDVIIVDDRYTLHQLDPARGMDLNIGRRALTKKKLLEALDVKAFATAYRKCLITMAVVSIKKRFRGDVIASLEDMAALEPYTSGDESRINAFVDASPIGDPQIRSCLLEDRNKGWVPKIVNLHKEKAPVFIAVGLAHISYGDKNLKNLLGKQGFIVQRVSHPNQKK